MSAVHETELHRILADLSALRLSVDAWAAIEADLRRVDEHPDGDSVSALASTTFEAKVQRRFQGGRAGGGAIPPTKQTTVLPYVGAICALLLFGVGALLGGGVILLGIGVLSAGVFVVAYAGSVVAHRPVDDDEPVVELVPMPPGVVALRERLLGTLGHREGDGV